VVARFVPPTAFFPSLILFSMSTRPLYTLTAFPAAGLELVTMNPTIKCASRRWNDPKRSSICSEQEETCIRDDLGRPKINHDRPIEFRSNCLSSVFTTSGYPITLNVTISPPPYQMVDRKIIHFWVSTPNNPGLIACNTFPSVSEFVGLQSIPPILIQSRFFSKRESSHPPLHL
jgi:hypothetical protein